MSFVDAITAGVFSMPPTEQQKQVDATEKKFEIGGGIAGAVSDVIVASGGVGGIAGIFNEDIRDHNLAMAQANAMAMNSRNQALAEDNQNQPNYVLIGVVVLIMVIVLVLILKK